MAVISHGAAGDGGGDRLQRLAEAALALSQAGTPDEACRRLEEAIAVIVGVPATVSRVGGEGDQTTGGSEAAAALVVPLVGREGRLGTVRLAAKAGGERFSADDEAVLVQLAQMAAAAVEGLELVARERRLRSEAEAAGRHNQLLSEASDALSRSLIVDDVARALTERVVPHLSDWCGVYLASTDRTIVRVADAAVDDELREVVAELGTHRPARLDDAFGTGAAIRTGRPSSRDRLTPEFLVDATDGELPAHLLRQVGPHALLAVPLMARGQSLGALTIIRCRRSFEPAEEQLAAELARRAGLALDNALRFGAERDAASILQRALLPDLQPRSAIVEVAARYLPGGDGAEVGGDWYDVIELSDGHLAFVVGDVMGRGIPAATLMAELRTAVRAYLLEGHRPSAALGLVDRFLAARGELQLATCVVATFDPRAWRLVVASAGHPPPVLVDGGGRAEAIPVEPGPPLGVGIAAGAGHGGHLDVVVEVPGVAWFVAYTDGLVEGPEQAVDDGIATLVALAGKGVPGGAEHLVDRVIHGMGRGAGHDDDVAVLAVGLSAVRAVARRVTRRLELRPEPASAAAGRDVVVDALAEAGRTDLAETARLLTSELVTNAVVHGTGPIELEVEVPATGPVRVAVTDGSTRRPEPEERGHLLDRGRGLHLVTALATRWGDDPLPLGKRVWFEIGG